MQFVPGYAPAAPPFLGRFLPPLAEGIAAQYIERYSQKGDLVFDPFGQSVQVVVEALHLGRRVLAASQNPVSRLALSLAVRPPTVAELRSALTHLADAPKEGGRLESYVNGLYRTACAACGAEAHAEAFEWVDAALAFRTYTCLRCQHAALREPATAADQAWARRFAARGLDYCYLLDRVAPPDDPNRADAEEALAVYPPRLLAVLAAVLARFDAHHEDREVRRRLAGLIVAALDAASVLAQDRPRVLTALPRHYVEKNFWLMLENATEQLAGAAAPAPTMALADLLDGRAVAGVHLAPEPARDLAPRLPPGACALVLTAFPRPNQAYWTLSALWAAWLWGREAVTAMRAILHRRRYDWDWHAGALARTFASVRPALAPEGHWVGLLPEAEPGFTAAALVAADAAGYALAGAALRADTAEAQCLWRLAVPETAEPKEAGRKIKLETVARQGAEAALRARGEPARWSAAHLGAWRALAEKRLLAEKRDDAVSAINHRLDPVFRQAAHFRRLAAAPEDDLATGWWWLPEANEAAQLALAAAPLEPLADRVEEEVRRQLLSGAAMEEQAVQAAVCAAFPGAATPDQSLVLACLNSYARQVEPGMWQVRPEDTAAARFQELDAILAQLRALAVRNDYDVADTNPQAWREGGETVYLFAVTTAAALSACLLGPRLRAHRRFLVLPGGRAGLAAFKLRRDPRLSATLVNDNWVMLKFRHIRRMAANTALTRATLEPAFYADPLEEATQLALAA